MKKFLENGKISRICLYSCIVAVCFLYTGSAYMSQFYRLIPLYDAQTVDIITSCLNYVLQAMGILVFVLGLKHKPAVWGDHRFFVVLLFIGIPFMTVMQLAKAGIIVVVSGCIFHFLIGLYFGCYLSLFAKYVPVKNAGVSYGIAYAFGSVGTYILSLFKDGDFLVSKGITVLYIILAVLTIFLVYFGNVHQATDSENEPTRENESDGSLWLFSATVVVMMIISVIGSGLYYSLPQAADIDWNLIRAFYAIGLIVTGLIMDRSRWVGEILVAASLLYPLIAMALIGEGMNNTVALSFSYLFRGCLTVYYIISFTDIASSDRKRLFVAPLGLFFSRLTEACLTLLLMLVAVPNLVQIITMALFMIPLIVLIVIRQKNKVTPLSVPVDEQKKKAVFADKYHLTARETEILGFLAEGLTDDEIASKINISRNTVRFHVSNILKKTGTSSRVDAARSMQKFN